MPFNLSNNLNLFDQPDLITLVLLGRVLRKIHAIPPNIASMVVVSAQWLIIVLFRILVTTIVMLIMC